MTEMIPVDTSMQDDDESEWELEYDEEETEDFFVTLDLTKHSTPASLARLRQVPVIKRPRVSTPASVRASSPSQVSSKPETQPTKDDLQFLDLHTANPVLAYKGQTYSCTWTTQLGTDVFVSDKTSGIANKGEAKVISASSVRLIARPVDLVRKEVKIVKEVQSSRDNETPQSNTPGASNSDDAAPPTRDPSFFDRLASVKATKGESDRPIQIQRSHYRVPEKQQIAKKRKRSDTAQMPPPPPPRPNIPRLSQPLSTMEPYQTIDSQGRHFVSLPPEQRPHRGPGSRGGRVRAANNFQGASSNPVGTLSPAWSTVTEMSDSRSQSVGITGLYAPPAAMAQAVDSDWHRASTVDPFQPQATCVGQPLNGAGISKSDTADVHPATFDLELSKVSRP